MYSKGKGGGKGDSKGGKGPGNQQPNGAAYYIAMPMKAMKGGGKSFSNQAGQYSASKGGGKGAGRKPGGKDC